MKRGGRGGEITAVIALRSALALPALMCFSATAMASDRSFGEHGGYDVVAIEGTSETDRGGCIMAEDDFEGPGGTRLRIMRFVAHPEVVAVVVSNYNWTSKADETYELTYALDDKEYSRDATGTVDSIYHGFRAYFPQDEFLNLFAKSKSLHIFKGDTVVDKLSLDGSGAARAAFDRCWAYALADDRAKARERARWQDIPKDPFGK